jgi:hypothetical protein
MGVWGSLPYLKLAKLLTMNPNSILTLRTNPVFSAAALRSMFQGEQLTSKLGENERLSFVIPAAVSLPWNLDEGLRCAKASRCLPP